MKPPVFVAILVAACGLAVACGLAAAQNSKSPDPDPTRFESEIGTFEDWDRKNSFPKDAVLFVGSSSIRMWQTAECFPRLELINRGFGGSHIADVNHFADRIVIKYRPRLIVFYAGDNDIEAGKSPEQVVDDFKMFVALVRRPLPETRIIYLPIKPSIARWAKWPQMRAANALVQKLAEDDDGLVYVDTATPMLGRDGQPRTELFLDDGLHLNAKGYRLWTGILRPALDSASVQSSR